MAFLTPYLLDDDTSDSGALVIELGGVDDEVVAGPIAVVAAEDQALALGGVPSGEVVPGPAVVEVVDPDVEPPDPRQVQSPIRVLNLDTGEWLTRDRARTWTDPLSDSGSGSLVLQADDPQLAALPADTRLVFHDGPRACYPVIVDHYVAHTVADGEEAQQVVTVSGPSLLDEWRRMVVYPDLGAQDPARLLPPSSETRFFNHAVNTAFTDVDTSMAVATDPRYGRLDERFAQPDGWPDLAAQWIWDRSSASPVPPGNVYFRTRFKLPAGVSRVRAFAAADDDYELWIDGVKVLERDGYYSGQSESAEFPIDGDFHLFAAVVHNRWGRGGFLFSLLPVTTGGQLGTPIRRSDTTWEVLGYSAPPRFTVGKILRILLTEAKQRGGMAGWSLSFTDKVDSAGNPWPGVTDVTVRVGMDGLSVLRQLAETNIDFAVSRGGARVLHAWRLGERGRASGVDFAPGVNLTDLGVESQA